MIELSSAQMLRLLDRDGALVEREARVYAQGRLDSTRKGDRWVHIERFTEQAVEEKRAGGLSLQRLYDRMLRAGEHVFGGDGQPATDPGLELIPGGAS